MRIYERLSQVYDSDWGDCAKQYVGWINELLNERGLIQAKILDIACGTGTLAVELAQRGNVVLGIDISKEMIDKAKLKSAGISKISFDIQDMIRVDVKGRFDVVTCTFDSINYILNSGDLRKMLSRVVSILYKGGLFIFDSNTKELYLSHSDEIRKMELDGQSFIQYCSYDSTRNVATTTFAFSDGTYEIHKQRPYDYCELAPFLKRAGFTVLHLFSWFGKMPYTLNTPKLFCVAERHT